MSRGTNLKTLFPKLSIQLECQQPFGDCFYLCVEKAFVNVNSDINVQWLRSNVSDHLTEEQFSILQSAQQHLRDFASYHKFHDLSEWQEAIKICGTSRHPSVYATDAEIQIVSDLLNVTFLIFNNETTSSSRRSSSSTGKSDCLFISPSSSNNTHSGTHYYIVVHRSRRQHYDLVRVENKLIFDETTLSSAFFDLLPSLIKTTSYFENIFQLWKHHASLQHITFLNSSQLELNEMKTTSNIRDSLIHELYYFSKSFCFSH